MTTSEETKDLHDVEVYTTVDSSGNSALELKIDGTALLGVISCDVQFMPNNLAIVQFSIKARVNEVPTK